MHYEDYEFDDFISDDSFINFATGKKRLDVTMWEKRLSLNPKNKQIALETKVLIHNLRFKKQNLSDEFISKEWFKLSNKLNLSEVNSPVVKNSIFKKSIWQYAAAAILILFFVCTIYFLNSTPKCDKEITYSEIDVPKAEIKSKLLPDGTLVFINSDSKLKYKNCFGEEQREIFLEGEAFFDVKYNAEKPFIVHTKDKDITVLGTAFNVSAYPDENIFSASLERGKISVSHNTENEVELQENQTYLYNRNTNKSKIEETPDIESYSSWKDGKIVFRNQRFIDIIRKLERSHNVIFSLQNEQLGDYRFTGTFTIDNNINTILEVIMLPTAFNYKILSDTIVIY